MALVATIVVRALMTWNAPVRVWIAVAPAMPSAPAISPVTNNAVEQLQRPSRLERQAQVPAELETAAVRIHHPREVEPARRPARIAAVRVAREYHAHRFEIL